MKARTTYYLAVEIINDGYSFERLWTCSPEHEHTTLGEAAPCLFTKKYGNLYGGVGAGATRRPNTGLAYSPPQSNRGRPIHKVPLSEKTG